ncbi:MAG: hypothetical protein JST22_21470 [Bacteroidetes bacterium]|nr:hypothetical protein [Bacteroidota bacterium]
MTPQSNAITRARILLAVLLQTFSLLVGHSHARAQQVHPFIITAGTTVNDERFYAVERTSGGDIVAVGSQTTTSITHVLVFKADANGRRIWSETFDIPMQPPPQPGFQQLSSCAYAVCEAPDDHGYIITGYYEMPNSAAPNGRQRNIFLMKVQAGGALTWVQTYAATYDATGRSVRPVVGGYLVAGGESESVASLSAVQHERMIAIRTDATGFVPGGGTWCVDYGMPGTYIGPPSDYEPACDYAYDAVPDPGPAHNQIFVVGRHRLFTANGAPQYDRSTVFVLDAISGALKHTWVYPDAHGTGDTLFRMAPEFLQSGNLIVATGTTNRGTPTVPALDIWSFKGFGGAAGNVGVPIDLGGNERGLGMAAVSGSAGVTRWLICGEAVPAGGSVPYGCLVQENSPFARLFVGSAASALFGVAATPAAQQVAVGSRTLGAAPADGLLLSNMNPKLPTAEEDVDNCCLSCNGTLVQLPEAPQDPLELHTPDLIPFPAGPTPTLPPVAVHTDPLPQDSICVPGLHTSYDVDADMGTSGVQTSDGGYVVAGYERTPSESDGHNMLVIRTASDGSVQWVSRPRTPFNNFSSDEYAYSVREDFDNDLIVAGDIKFNGDGVSAGYAGSTDSNMIVSRIVGTGTDAGTFLWMRMFGRLSADGGKNECARAVQTTWDRRGYIVAGHSNTNWGGALPNEGYHLFIVKTDENGKIAGDIHLWQNVYGLQSPSVADTMYAASVEPARNAVGVTDGYIIAGSCRLAGDSRFRMLAMKIDDTGNPVWCRSYGAAEADYRATGIRQLAFDGASDIVLSGYRVKGGDTDAVLLRIGWDGAYVWSYGFDASTCDMALSVTEDCKGGVALCGVTRVSVPVDQDHQAFVLRLLMDNNQLPVIDWGIDYPVPGNGDNGRAAAPDDAAEITNTADGNYCVAGSTCTYQGNPGTGGTSDNASKGNVYLQRVSCEGYLCKSESRTFAMAPLTLDVRTHALVVVAVTADADCVPYAFHTGLERPICPSTIPN